MQDLNQVAPLSISCIFFFMSVRPDSIVSETYFSGYIQYSFTVVSKVEYLKFHALLGQWKYGGKYFVSWDVTPCGLGGMCFIFQGQSIHLRFVKPEDHNLIIFIFGAVLEH